jgi:D-alanyl-D-alanine carboxypeptidase
MVLLLIFLSFFQITNIPDSKNLNSVQNSIFDLESFSQENFNYLNLSDLTANSVLVKEINSKTLFSKNSDQEKEIASLTKLMSAYLGYNLYLPDSIFIFDRESINQEGDVGNFLVGEKITRDDILKASLVASSNDAIYLLAKNYGLNAFVNLMNQKTKEWQMTKTNFVDPTGLGKNISTAKDLYLLLTKIYSQTPEIFSWTRLKKIIINNKILWTTNLLLSKQSSIIIGGKTGYKNSAGENLALILKLEKSPFINIIILDSKDRFGDAEKIIKALKNYYGE